MQREQLIVVGLNCGALKLADLRIIPNNRELNSTCTCTLLYSLFPCRWSLHREAAAMPVMRPGSSYSALGLRVLSTYTGA